MANYFTDRVAQYPGRVVMNPVSGEANTYDMSRAEGTVTEEGTPFNAEAFNAIANRIHAYGTCSTGASTSAKVVTCPGFALETGAAITVYFSNAQTSTSSCTLNVNGTGAKTIYGPPRSTTSTTRLDGAWEANEAKTFVYDGTNWRILDRNIITSSELTDLENKLGL